MVSSSCFFFFFPCQQLLFSKENIDDAVYFLLYAGSVLCKSRCGESKTKSTHLKSVQLLFPIKNFRFFVVDVFIY